MTIRYTIKDMQNIAREHGGKCLSKEYIDLSTPLEWMCRKGHTWDADYDIVRQGGWCSQCAKEEDKEERLENLQEIAAAKDGKCLSSSYINNVTKLKWQCKEGHVWNARPTNIQTGTWCPYCAGTIKKTLKDMHLLAKHRGGKCLSSKYVNIQTKLKWQCSKGHIWMTRPIVIIKGFWCPHCSGKAKKTLKDIHLLAKQHGGRCLSSSYINNCTKLKWQCKEGHIWGAALHDIQSSKWCPRCAGISKHTIEEMKSFAKFKGGKCLSSHYVNSITKLKWQCSKGHIWMTKPIIIISGFWCPRCSGNAKKTLRDMHLLAKQNHGGICLSSSYINNHTKIKWQCKEGHVWMAMPKSIQRGRWCPQCSRTIIWQTRRQNEKLKKELV